MRNSICFLESVNGWRYELEMSEYSRKEQVEIMQECLDDAIACVMKHFNDDRSTEVRAPGRYDQICLIVAFEFFRYRTGQQCGQ